MTITIRHSRPDDYDAIAEIYENEDVIGQTSQIPYLDAQFWRDFYRSHGSQGVELVAIVDTLLVGHLGIVMNERPRRKHAAWFGIAVHAQHHGQGVGRALMEKMIHLADNWLNLGKLELSVFADNPRAVALYEQCGFVHEGRARCDTFKNGKYVDTLRMARFHPAFEPAK